jgi:hypothetical protein
MKLEDYSNRYSAITAKASEVNRQLALAGIAIIWIFKNPETANTLIPATLVTPLFFFLLSLAIDLIHYVVGSIVWGLFFEIKERQVNKGTIQDDNIKAPNILSWILTFIFFIKISSMIVGAYYLIMFIYPRFQF